MPTLKQKELAKAIVENAAKENPVTAKALLVSVGYKSSTASRKPGEIIEQTGVQSELVKLGFTEDNAKLTVTEIMLNQEAEPNARLKAADMTFKVHGSYAPDKSINLNVNTNIKQDPKTKALADEYEAKLMDTLQDG